MSDITLKKLELALTRLLNGEPQKTPSDGKINISRINDEAGLSAGHIYYYRKFIESARKKIKLYEKERSERQIEHEFEAEKTEIDKLKLKLDDALRLKNKYRQEKIEQKLINDGLVAQNTSLAFRLFELETENKRISDSRVVRLNDY